MMFEKYMKERQNAECLKYDSGFIFYRIQGEECFIVEMYVEPEKRGSSLFKTMIEDLSKLGSKVISATIYLSDPGCNHSLRSALKIGFKVISANNNVLLIVKEL